MPIMLPTAVIRELRHEDYIVRQLRDGLGMIEPCAYIMGVL
jgi:hypothetical protein